MVEAVSRLFKIDMQEDSRPLDLYREWVNDAKNEFNEFQATITNIATVSKDGTVSNRSVLIQEDTDDGLMFNTSRTSRKHADIQNHPQVSLCFFWTATVNGEKQTRQVRVEGIAKEMSEEYTCKRYRSWSLRRKLRYGFCNQGNEILWEELKKRHEEFLKEYESTKVIDMSPDTVCYTVSPHRVEYYASILDQITIADRVLFRRNENGWYFVHVEA